jgi:tRNA dimethylallyltransferase
MSWNAASAGMAERELDIPAPPDALVIIGATATGKTALSIAVARALNGEIISLDSRQIYRGLDIGTAKPSAEELAAVPHFGIDIVNPDERYSSGRFARDARQWLANIRARGHVPVLAGGTGFFLRALTHPLFREPDLPALRRDALQAWLDRQPESELRRWLTALDPGLLQHGSRQVDRQRVTRALEVALLTGQPLSWWHHHAPPTEQPLHALVFRLELPRAELYARINTRVLTMMEAGLLQEVERLREQGYDEHAPGMKATGYSELLAYLRGECDLAAAVDAIQRNTRRYARRQHTWLRHQLPPCTVPLDALQPRSELVDTIVRKWQGEVSSAHRN